MPAGSERSTYRRKKTMTSSTHTPRRNSYINNGRLANGYFVNGYFELQFARETTFLGELEGRLFLPEGSAFSLPFSPLVSAF